MKITKEMKELRQMMWETNLTKETRIIIGSNLVKKEQIQEMIEYLKKYKKIMTDHQALQHADKIMNKCNQKNDFK